jgi:hypothetical protein
VIENIEKGRADDQPMHSGAGFPCTGVSVRQYSPVNSTPKLSFWPLAIAAAVLAVLLAVAMMR